MPFHRLQFLFVALLFTLGFNMLGNTQWVVAATPFVSFQDEGLSPAPEEAQSQNANQSKPKQESRSGLSFLSLLLRGGWFMIPLAALSLAVFALGIERWLALRKEKLFPTRLVSQLARIAQLEGGLDPRNAYQICQKFPSSASYVLRSVLTRVGRPQAEIENCLSESTQREATRLNQVGSWLTLAAAIAPLIGLLGTVWGITQAFYDTTQLVEGQNRAEALAQGIYTALVTTMCGLMIAIPAAILAHFFENRIISTMNQIEEMVTSLLPQFERYEGQLRFTDDGLESKPSAAKDSVAVDRNGSDDALPTVRPK